MLKNSLVFADVFCVQNDVGVEFTAANSKKSSQKGYI